MITNYNLKFRFFGALHPILYFATTPPAVGGDGGSGGAPTGSPAATGGGGSAPPATPGTAPASQAPGTINWETAPQHFRDGYNKLKSDFEKLTNDYKPWQEWSQKVGITHDALPAVHGTYQAVYETIDALAEQLGLPQDEIDEAVDKHGIIKVLNHLQGKAAQARKPGDDESSLQERIDAALQQRMGPIEERENVRLTDAANNRFEQIVHSSIVEAYKAEGVDVANIPEAESFMLMNATSELLKYDEEALVALKRGQGQAAVQKAFQQAKTYLDQYYLSRSGRERGRIQGPPKVQAPGQPARKPSLDEMIEEPTLINNKYKVGT